MTTPGTLAALAADEKVDRLLRTLRYILRLTKKQGNWLRVDTEDSVGDDPDNVPAGYCDMDNPTHGYDETGRPIEPDSGEALIPVFLIPVFWDEDYAEGPENRLIQIREEAETILTLLATPAEDASA